MASWKEVAIVAYAGESEIKTLKAGIGIYKATILCKSSPLTAPPKLSY